MKYSLIVATFIIVLAGCAEKKNAPLKSELNDSINEVTTTEQNVTLVINENTTTYTNTDFRFTIQYPKEWGINDTFAHGKTGTHLLDGQGTRYSFTCDKSGWDNTIEDKREQLLSVGGSGTGEVIEEEFFSEDDREGLRQVRQLYAEGPMVQERDGYYRTVEYRYLYEDATRCQLLMNTFAKEEVDLNDPDRDEGFKQVVDSLERI